MIAERQTSTTRSPAQLANEIELIERALLDARREHRQARTNRQRLIAGGDPLEVEACNAEVTRTGKLIEQLTEQAEDTREAIKLAKARDIQIENEKNYKRIAKAVNEAANAAEKLDNIIQLLGEAFTELADTKQVADNALWQSGVQPLLDRLSAAEVMNLTELGLYVFSNGHLGKKRSIESIEQVRESGLAKLSKAAVEYRELTLRHARMTLRLHEVK